MLPRFALNRASTDTAEFTSDYGLTESILAAYIMGAGEFGPIEVIGGVRVEATDVRSYGFAIRTVAGAIVPSVITADGDYTEALPSLLVNYRPSEDWVIRGAITRAMGRPGYEQIAPRTTYGENGNTINVSIGNPDLIARKSWNYDASVEFYPSPLTVLAALGVLQGHQRPDHVADHDVQRTDRDPRRAQPARAWRHQPVARGNGAEGL